ncbi:hypothetical protein GCM10010256_43440 [Streptomyces coeruleorubidus]|nr:hypothetical protein GCM10010256_43440 [Streptomyces coeruleorubidus]
MTFSPVHLGAVPLRLELLPLRPLWGGKLIATPLESACRIPARYPEGVTPRPARGMLRCAQHVS